MIWSITFADVLIQDWDNLLANFKPIKYSLLHLCKLNRIDLHNTHVFSINHIRLRVCSFSCLTGCSDQWSWRAPSPVDSRAGLPTWPAAALGIASSSAPATPDSTHTNIHTQHTFHRLWVPTLSLKVHAWCSLWWLLALADPSAAVRAPPAFPSPQLRASTETQTNDSRENHQCTKKSTKIKKRINYIILLWK